MRLVIRPFDLSFCPSALLHVFVFTRKALGDLGTMTSWAMLLMHALAGWVSAIPPRSSQFSGAVSKGSLQPPVTLFAQHVPFHESSSEDATQLVESIAQHAKFGLAQKSEQPEPILFQTSSSLSTSSNEEEEEEEKETGQTPSFVFRVVPQHEVCKYSCFLYSHRAPFTPLTTRYLRTEGLPCPSDRFNSSFISSPQFPPHPFFPPFHRPTPTLRPISILSTSPTCAAPPGSSPSWVFPRHNP